MSHRGPGWWLAVAAGVAMLAAVIAGIGVIGTPMQLRAKRLDVQRVVDLRALMDSVDRYWFQHKSLPHDMADLDALKRNKRDPDSGKLYAYVVVDPTHYRLCARFDTATDPDVPQPYDPAHVLMPSNDPAWRHPRGRTCFERQVDTSHATPSLHE